MVVALPLVQIMDTILPLIEADEARLQDLPDLVMSLKSGMDRRNPTQGPQD